MNESIIKHEYRKHEKEIYNPNTKPEIIEVPKFKYFCIKGIGNPNNEDFNERVQVLYALSYTLKMMPKKGVIPNGYFDYTVYPLEGLWDLSDNAKANNVFDKNELVYTIMIRQPDFLTNDDMKLVFEQTALKKDLPLLKEAYYDEIEDGLSIQILHKGSFDTETLSFDVMKDYLKDNNYHIKTLVHREIYLSDPRKVSSDKLKTILRYQIIKMP